MLGKGRKACDLWMYLTQQTATDVRAGGSKFKAHCYDKVVCPTCVRTECNSMYFVRVAAVFTKRGKEKYVIWNAAIVTTVKYQAVTVSYLTE